MKLVGVFAIMVTALSFAGCVSEADRYAWSIEHVHICTSARALSKNDIAEVVRVVTHASPQEAIYIAMDRPDHSLQKLQIGTASPHALELENPDRTSFGFCVVVRSGQSWKVVEKYTDLDPGLLYVGCD